MLSPDAWAVLIVAGAGLLLQAGAQMGYLKAKLSGLKETVQTLDGSVKTLSEKVDALLCVEHGQRLQDLEKEKS